MNRIIVTREVAWNLKDAIAELAKSPDVARWFVGCDQIAGERWIVTPVEEVPLRYNIRHTIPQISIDMYGTEKQLHEWLDERVIADAKRIEPIKPTPKDYGTW